MWMERVVVIVEKILAAAAGGQLGWTVASRRGISHQTEPSNVSTTAVWAGVLQRGGKVYKTKSKAWPGTD